MNNSDVKAFQSVLNEFLTELSDEAEIHTCSYSTTLLTDGDVQYSVLILYDDPND